MELNPRYLAYCQAQGRNPEDQLRHDEWMFPGGCMAGFILWTMSHMSDFRKSHPKAWSGWAIRDQDAWTRFLQERAKGSREG